MATRNKKDCRGFGRLDELISGVTQLGRWAEFYNPQMQFPGWVN